MIRVPVTCDACWAIAPIARWRSCSPACGGGVSLVAMVGSGSCGDDHDRAAGVRLVAPTLEQLDCSEARALEQPGQLVGVVQVERLTAAAVDLAGVAVHERLRVRERRAVELERAQVEAPGVVVAQLLPRAQRAAGGLDQRALAGVWVELQAQQPARGERGVQAAGQ